MTPARRAAKKRKRELRQIEELEKSYDDTYHRIELNTVASSMDSKKFYNTPEWKQLRYRVLREYGPVCMLCGSSPRTGAVVQVDHIRPRSIYPELAFDFHNLQVLCKICNEGKSNIDATDWRDGGKTYLIRRNNK